MAAIIPPLLVQITLTLVIYVVLVTLRVGDSLRDQEVKKAVLAGNKDRYSRTPQLLAQNLSNQFELPVLFVAAVVLAVAADAVTPILVTCAWIFAISRLVHAAIHCTINVVPLRASVFAIGLIAVVVMWWSLGTSLLGGVS